MTFGEMVEVVERCAYPGYEFTVRLNDRGELFLQAGYMEPDTTNGLASWQTTRRWLLSPSMEPSEIVQTVFKCVVTSMEHRAREWFRYREQPVFGPHFDVEALVELCRRGKFVHRT